MLEWVSEFTLNLAFGEEKEETFSADELETVVSIGTQDGVFNPWEKKLIEQIFDFNEVYAVERMTPRPDILALDVESTREEVEKVIQGVKYSKIPVYEEEFDHIVGYIQVKMFLLFPEKSIRELLVPVHIVPEMKRVDKLLEEMQAKKTKMAVLLDEYANVQGIVTIRDILEILFGDLSSFPKKVKANIYKLREQVYRVPGRTSLREINEFIDYDLFDEDAENSDTIAGYLLSMAELNRLPAVGDSYETDDYRISVRKVMKRRIMEVELQVVKSMELEAK
jgi:putative hemolysin